MHHTPPHFENLGPHPEGMGAHSRRGCFNSYGQFIYIHIFTAIYMGQRVLISNRSTVLPAALTGEPPRQWQFPTTDWPAEPGGRWGWGTLHYYSPGSQDQGGMEKFVSRSSFIVCRLTIMSWSLGWQLVRAREEMPRTTSGNTCSHLQKVGSPLL